MTHRNPGRSYMSLVNREFGLKPKEKDLQKVLPHDPHVRDAGFRVFPDVRHAQGSELALSPNSFACVAASSRLPSFAIRSCRRCQHVSRSATEGGKSTVRSMAMCSQQTLPSIRRDSTRLACRRVLVSRKRANM
jgi:hypothetical protein